MQRQGNRLVYSPSDLVRFLESPYASWMERLRLERPGEVTPDEDDPQLALVRKEGHVREHAHRDRLLADGVDVCEIEDGPNAVDATRQAIQDGREVIYQAALELAPFAGRVDFLERTDEHGPDGNVLYDIWDTKLAKSPKPDYLVQLCAYAEMLERILGVLPKRVGLILGDGTRRAFRTEDFVYYYRFVKQAFLDQMAAFDPDDPPEPDARADHGRWQSHADAWLRSVDHLSRVAGMHRVHRMKLEEAGITTLAALAEAKPKLDCGIPDMVFRRLRTQARLQRRADEEPPPAPYEIVARRGHGLAKLPPASPGDVFLDLEGYPFAEGGLEYLWGCAYVDEHGEPAFQDFWGFDAAGEKRAFEQCIDWILDRWRADPSMHVYHYASYEVDAFKRLMGKYGTREEEVDHLLRQHVFVDLFRVVYEGLRIGTPNYSLKNVEKQYMRREGEVETAGQSIVYFGEWLESGQPRDWRESPILKEIRDYNEDDCESTRLWVAWLRERHPEADVTWEQPTDTGDAEVERLEGGAAERRALADALLAALPDDPADDTDDQTIQRLLAHLVEFHRREDKPVWWDYFARHDWEDYHHVRDLNSIGQLKRAGEPKPYKRSLAYTYRFRPDQDTKVKEGSKVCFAGVFGEDDKPITFTVIDIDTDKGELRLQVGAKAQAALPGGLPDKGAVFLHEKVSVQTIVDALQAVVETWRDSQVLPAPLRSLILRKPPPLIGRAGGPLLRDGDDVLSGTLDVVRAMDGGTLAVQGPPGSGKTYVGSSVISALLDEGKDVGITANSHKVIVNLAAACLERREEAGRDLAFLKVGNGDDDPLFEHSGVRHVQSSGDGATAYGGGLIGGTAWLFARDDMQNRLDYLFVDEAGQVSLANLIAMSRAAKNIVLLGDQMQLPQPLQGTHPGDAGLSALDYVMGDHATVPDDLGIFLRRTWRMHPDVCDFISGAIYEGRLEPEAHTKNRVIELPTGGGGIVSIEAGILFSPVEHEGNRQASQEEVARIKELVASLLGREHTDRDGQPRGGIKLDDILFVAPYNMQVRKIKRAIPGADVASVDKFQGQQAPIVIVSLCTSYGERGPRGLDFVLDKQRLNVAVSRAQSLAIVVGDPRLARNPVRSIAQMERQNLLCRLLEVGLRS